MNFYGHTKLAIEGLLPWYSQLKGMRFASLRYFNAAGYDVQGVLKGLEKEPGNLMPIVMEAVMVAGKKLSSLETTTTLKTAPASETTST